MIYRYFNFVVLLISLVCFQVSVGFANQSNLKFEIPILCNYGKDCFIQNYVDVDNQQNSFQDFKCGKLSYDKHDGTDFRISRVHDIDKNYPVIASANGVVIGIRNNIEDISYDKVDKNLIKNKECGNGVVIKHEYGYETQYCHLKKGSIKVKVGDKVNTGTPLGYVGLSGMTVFPHVHFSIRQNGKQLDPFTGLIIGKAESNKCHEKTPTSNLWSEKAAEALQYIDTAILFSGFSDKAITPDEARAKSLIADLPKNTDAIVFYSEIMGVKQGDIINIEIIAPDKQVIVSGKQQIEKPMATYFAFAGKKRRDLPFAIGEYIGKITLFRGGTAILSDEKSLIVKDK